MSREAGVGSGGPPPLVLILSPTRELALQIAVEAKQLCTFHKLGVVALVGGTSVDSDRRALNRPSGGDSLTPLPPPLPNVLLHTTHSLPYHTQATIPLTYQYLTIPHTHSSPSVDRGGHLGGVPWAHAGPPEGDARFRQTVRRRQGRHNCRR